jgi:hypothetical protein
MLEISAHPSLVPREREGNEGVESVRRRLSDSLGKDLKRYEKEEMLHGDDRLFVHLRIGHRGSSG